MENWNWKTSVHFRLTEQNAPTEPRTETPCDHIELDPQQRFDGGTTLCGRCDEVLATSPEPRTETPCDHVALDPQQRFDGGTDTLCGRCDEVLATSPADPNVCTIIDASGDPFDDGIYAGKRMGLIYTSGVHLFAEDNGAHWLIDLIASHQPNVRKRASDHGEFQVWYVVPTLATQVTVACYEDTPTDTTQPTVKQHVPFTDLVLSKKLKLYVRDNVLMLPEEY